MNIEFYDDVEMKVISKKNIRVAGVRIGYVEESANSRGRRFHAVIEGFPGGLIQGHGDTEEQAVQKAVLDNIEVALARVDALEHLQNQLSIGTIQPTGTED